MKLTKAQYRNDNAVLSARLRAAEAVAARALAEVRRLTQENERLETELDEARNHPALATNIRLAHDLEQCEVQRDAALTELHAARDTLTQLAHRYPDAFPKDAA